MFDSPYYGGVKNIPVFPSRTVNATRLPTLLLLLKMILSRREAKDDLEILLASDFLEVSIFYVTESTTSDKYKKTIEIRIYFIPLISIQKISDKE